tara:strand:- start:19800 stop:20456 length:657 start_codon:yes stop_codon:yes gene_type:complete
MINKKAYSIQMSYNVSDDEKKLAEKALLYFDFALKKLNIATNHLNIMKTPFKENPQVDPKSIMQARAALRRFRDKAIDNFNEFKIVCFNCVNIMQSFASDTQSLKLMKSFISSIDGVEVKVNDFADLFLDLQSKEFVNDIVKTIEDIQKESDSLEEIIDERIKNHIQSNILAKSWVDSISNDLQINIEKKTPLILDLFNERQDQLNQLINDKLGSNTR